MIEEFWKPVFGYEGTYSVSSFGRVRRDRKIRSTWAGRVLKNSDPDKGYPSVMLSQNGTSKSFRVHNLVARAFIGNNPERYDVNHKDTNKRNNIVSNLEYVNHKENMRHAYSNGCFKNRLSRKGEDHPRSKLTERDVLDIREKYNKKGISPVELSKEYGLDRTYVHRVIHRKSWRHI